MSAKSHKLAAIVFTDIVGYTKQMEENEQKTMHLLQKQRDIIFPLVESYDGKVIKEIGDGLMMMFNSAVQAVRFAISVQSKLVNEDLTIRAGIHIGDVIFEDGDVFGSAVNTAARIEPLAEPNGICISEDVRMQLRNKKEIRLISMGRKQLKGVSEPIEVYSVFIEGVTQQEKVTFNSFIKDLWNRRVIQIIAGYLLSAWIIRLAIADIVSRNMLSPHLVDLAWIIFISLLPTVFLLTYFHSKRKSKRWTKAELIGLPTNVVFTVVLLVIMFQGRDLGATTSKVIVENEDGDKIERTVVKSEFRKKIALYNFTNLTNDTTLHWLQYTIPSMIEYDLSQDRYITPRAAVKFFRKIAQAGFKDGVNLPITAMRNFAENSHLNYFLAGEFTYDGNVYIIETKLYDTKTSKLIASNSFTNESFFELVDEISIQVKKDLEIPEYHIEETKDLPIAEIFSGSEEAIMLFSASNRAIIFNDYTNAIKYMSKAIEVDPGFAIAHLSIANFYFNANRPEKSLESLEAIMENYQNLNKLPETIQFFVKFFYYLLKQDASKADAVVKMWVELYPEDTEGRSMLAGRYINKGMPQEAIAQYKEILKLDPENYNILRSIGGLFKEYGNYDSALIYYQLYANQFPGDFKSYRELGDLYMKSGDYEKASENFDRALLIKSDEIYLQLRKAEIESLKGNYDKALELYNISFSDCKTAEDTAYVYESIQEYYVSLGQYKKATEYQEKLIETWRTFKPPKDILVYQTFMISHYIIAGETEKAFQTLKNIEEEFQPPLDKVASFGYLFAYIELEDSENAKIALQSAEKLIEGFGEQLLMANIHYANGKINEIEGNYEGAIEAYKEFLKMQPTSVRSHRWLARSYREAGSFKEALKHIEICLKEAPFSPSNNFEAGQIYLEMGDKKTALEHFQQAAKVWQNADENYKPALETQKFLAELSGT
ncbi:MAG: tetratricopeptide repeat protein [Bacteroidales bacterium]|nr:tetratricopeptide repeat protein [Bacteroidales bacterium]MCF8405449.1 tetratricopeptide repeat protein [Bacteroidales bacterium]